MRQGMRAVLYIGLLGGCGNIHSPGFPQDAQLEQPSAMTPAPAAPPSGGATSPFTLVAKLNVSPRELPNEHVRAALVWLDGHVPPACESGECSVFREQTLTINSDVPVEVTFPLMLRLPVEVTQPFPTKSFHSELPDSPLWAVHDTDFYSLPQAEVVLYVDGNHNQRLDLLQPGERGPGPDRILALSSGHDTLGNAVRSVVINKRGPLDFAHELSPLPGLEALQNPLPPELQPDPEAHPYPDGLYVVRSSAGVSQPFAEAALLKSHGLYQSSLYDGRWDSQLLGGVISEIQPLADADIALLPVDPEQKTWLARGCMLYPLEHGQASAAPPPVGAEVLCGAGALVYASNPEDYCGQTQYLVADTTLSMPDWWPCDDHGLKPGAPYIPATTRFDTDLLQMYSSVAITGTLDVPPRPDYRCDSPNIVLDLDAVPVFHLPSMAPPTGSQVLCYGADALSFVPNTTCLTKFTYDLSSSTIPGYPTNFPAWDLRNDRPTWWPCDANGELITGNSYTAPQPLETGSCEPPLVDIVPAYYAPPAHSQIRCLSSTQLIAQPLWSDVCDGRQTMASSGGFTLGSSSHSWAGPNPEGWPCDADGNFVPTPGYVELD